MAKWSFRSILILISVLLPAPAFAQSTAVISGVVTDQIGRPVSGAAASLVRDGQPVDARTTTDADGRFTFAPVQAGRYEVEVRSAGFLTGRTTPFFAAASARVSVPVTLSIGISQSVAVTAAAIELPASQVGASVTVLDETTIDALATSSVSDLLRVVPGVHVLQSGGRGSVTSLFIRGGNSTFNKVLIDGVPANDIGGGFDFADLASMGVERVEVLRNANSVLYGSDALAGVVDVTTRRGRSRTPELIYAVEGGNLATQEHRIALGGARERVDYFTAFSNATTDNDVANDDYRRRAFIGRVGLAVGSNTDVTTMLRAGSVKGGSPNQSLHYGTSDDSRRTADEALFSVTANSTVTSRLRTMVRFAVVDRQSVFENPSPTGEPFDAFGFGANYLGHTVTIDGADGRSVTGQAYLDYGGVYPQRSDASTTRTLLSGQASFHAARSLDVSTGVRTEQEDGEFVSAYGTWTTSRRNWGGFVEARAMSPRVSVTAGVGFDHHAIFGNAATPRLSLSLFARQSAPESALGDTKLMFNVGKGIKAPDVFQEASSLVSIVGAEAAARLGVPSIGPERGQILDIGVEQTLAQGRVRLRATAFRNRFTDLIESVSQSLLPQLGVPVDAAAMVQGGAYVNAQSYSADGLELSGELQMGSVAVALSYTVLDADVTKSFASGALSPAINPAFPGVPIGQFVPLVGARPFRRPAHVGSFLVRYARGREDLTVTGYLSGAQDDSTFLSDAFFGTSMLLPNHNLDAAFQKVDLTGGYQLTRRVRWSVSLDNLFNETYQPAAGYPGLPRTFRTGVTVTVGGAGRRP